MSNLPGNPIGEKYGDKQGLSAEVVAALIVAHEIRTANLIALMDTSAGRLVLLKDGDEAMDSMANEIKARLGLGDTNGNV